MTPSRLLFPLLLLCALLAGLGSLPARASSTDLLSALGIEASAQPKFLKVDEAFVLESEQQGDRITLTLRIADDYYLYRHSFRFKGENLAFEEPVLPAGTEHEDDFFGKTQVYYREVQIPVTLTEAGQQASLKISYQGCTDGLCYPPTDKLIDVAPLVTATTASTAETAQSVAPVSQQDQLAAALGHQGFWLSIVAFFALGLGLATTLVLTLTNLTISALRRWTPPEIRIPIYVMIIASVVSAVQMLINAYAFGLYQSLGIFIPLIVTNCIVVGRAEAFAAKKGPALSALDGFSIGMGATGAMFVLGSLREIIGNGTLFDGADGLLGSWAKVLRVEIFHTDTPFLLAMLPPGAFIGLGLMLAVKYLIDEKMKKRRAEAAVVDSPAGETGNA